MLSVNEDWEMTEMGALVAPNHRVYPAAEVIMPTPLYNLKIKLKDASHTRHFIMSAITHVMGFISNHSDQISDYIINAQIEENDTYRNALITKIKCAEMGDHKTYVFVTEKGETLLDLGGSVAGLEKLKTIYRRPA